MDCSSKLPSRGIDIKCKSNIRQNAFSSKTMCNGDKYYYYDKSVVKIVRNGITIHDETIIKN